MGTVMLISRAASTKVTCSFMYRQCREATNIETGSKTTLGKTLGGDQSEAKTTLDVTQPDLFFGFTTLFFKLCPQKKHAFFLCLDICCWVHDEVSAVCLNLNMAQYEQGNSPKQLT